MAYIETTLDLIEIMIKHHFRYDIFINQQSKKLNCMFSEQAIKLLTLCTCLDPKDSFSLLKIDDVCSLAVKLYPANFLEQERNTPRADLVTREIERICGREISWIPFIFHIIKSTRRIQVQYYALHVPTNSIILEFNNYC
jgi:hypothetical protein